MAIVYSTGLSLGSERIIASNVIITSPGPRRVMSLHIMTGAEQDNAEPEVPEYDAGKILHVSIDIVPPCVPFVCSCVEHLALDSSVSITAFVALVGINEWCTALCPRGEAATITRDVVSGRERCVRSGKR